MARFMVVPPSPFLFLTSFITSKKLHSEDAAHIYVFESTAHNSLCAQPYKVHSAEYSRPAFEYTPRQ